MTHDHGSPILNHTHGYDVRKYIHLKFCHYQTSTNHGSQANKSRNFHSNIQT